MFLEVTRLRNNISSYQDVENQIREKDNMLKQAKKNIDAKTVTVSQLTTVSTTISNSSIISGILSSETKEQISIAETSRPKRSVGRS
jgi:uncharacterized membrane protein YgaE (UPF0421/DUF939 family)